MPFNSYTFLIFFFLVAVSHHFLKSWKWQKTNLLAASYLFYSAWNPLFVFLLMASTLFDWILAKRIFLAEKTKAKKACLTASIAMNLGLLGYFKYGNFLLENSVVFLNCLGIHFSPAPADIVLPVGISFYTFQTLSYTIDVYRKKIEPGKSFMDYALYVSFFPQLVAGPIVRAHDFLPQCETPRKADRDQIGWGLSLITIGLFMKIVLADNILAPVVDPVYADPDNFRSIETWTAVFAFSGQIFCDFSGYSTVAIGVALCFGFALPDNFKYPYASAGFREFWGRWHISLSSWLRDYLYASLGGNRVSAARTGVNLMLTMLLGGLWHGASWLFVIWGGVHGLYLILEHSLAGRRPLFPAPENHWKIASSIFTFVIVSLTWVFFRSENVPDAMSIFHNLYSFSWTRNPSISSATLAFAAATSLFLLAWHIYMRNSSIESFFSRLPAIVRILVLLSMAIATFLFFSGDNNAFIYFQF